MATATHARRPSKNARRAAILEAAAQVFFEQGYAATSIDAIIKRLGGSKRTIYNEFGSKEGLFTALVSENAGTALSALAVDGQVCADEAREKGDDQVQQGRLGAGQDLGRRILQRRDPDD